MPSEADLLRFWVLRSWVGDAGRFSSCDSTASGLFALLSSQYCSRRSVWLRSLASLLQAQRAHLISYKTRGRVNGTDEAHAAMALRRSACLQARPSLP